MIIKDGTRVIKLKDDIIQRIHFFRQNECKSPEAGGILAGRENISNENLIIEYMTEPMHGDFQSRTRFDRKDTDHIAYFENIYKQNDGTVGYIGEWHTHPENVPHYSAQDLKNWKNIQRQFSGQKQQYHLIAGRKVFTIWKVQKASLFPKKIAEIPWNASNIMEDEI